MLDIFMLYEVNPTTWFYISSLMILCVFFKFRRVWSVRNYDLIWLLMLSPGMIMVAHGYDSCGYMTIHGVSLVLMLRMLCDPLMVRRPLLEVNLTESGLIFTCLALLIFLCAGVVLTQWREPASSQTATLEQLLRSRVVKRMICDEVEIELTDGISKKNATSAENLSENEGHHSESDPNIQASGIKPEEEYRNLDPELVPRATGSDTQPATPSPVISGASERSPVVTGDVSLNTNKKRHHPGSAYSQVARGPGLPFFQDFVELPRRFMKDAQRKQLSELKHKHSDSPETVKEHEESDAKIYPYAESITDKKNTSLDTSISTRASAPVVRPFGYVLLMESSAILGQLLVVLGMILIGKRHFENFGTGVAAATLYLLLPYTSQMPSRLDHIIPAVILIWAVVAYRRPIISGMLIGAASALIYYPVFLLPLWCAFYWSRGVLRFITSALSTIFILTVLAIIWSGGWGPFWSQSTEMLGFVGLFTRNADGLWNLEHYGMMFRIPVITTYVILAILLIFWPPQKNLGTLLSSSAVLMIGAQFCHPFQGGLYMAWYLPLMILVIFRPNLEDRVARKAVLRPFFVSSQLSQKIG